MYKFIVFIFAIFFLGCSSHNNLVLFKKNNNEYKLKQKLNKAAYKNNTPMNYQYKIQPENVLNIIIFNHPELNSIINTSIQNSANLNGANNLSGIKVYPNGTINLPLIGLVKVAGLTEEQASNKLTKLYSKYIKKPYVKVEVINKKIYVLGEVKHPRVINISSQDYISLIAAISDSGGFTNQAKRNEIKIISGDWSHPTVKIVNLTEISPKDINNLILKPNEIVYVPPIKTKPIDVKIQGIQPIISLINSVLGGIVDVKILSK